MDINNVLLFSDLRALYEECKPLKSSYILIDMNNIYGSDSNFCICRHMEATNIDLNMKFIRILTGGRSNFIVFSMDKLKKYISEKESSTIDTQLNLYLNNTMITSVDMQLKEYMNTNIIILIDNSVDFNDPNLMHKMTSIINTVLPATYIHHEELRGDPNFENAIAMKAAEGSAIYKYKDYLMSIYGSLFPINKSDTVYMDLSAKINGYFIAKFTIVKKKIIITQWVKYKDIW